MVYPEPFDPSTQLRAGFAQDRPVEGLLAMTKASVGFTALDLESPG